MIRKEYEMPITRREALLLGGASLLTLGAATVPSTIYVDKANTIIKNTTVGRIVVRAPGFQAINVTAVGTGRESTNVGLFDFTHAKASGTLTNCIVKPSKPSLWITGVLGHDFTAKNVVISRTVDGFGIYNTHNKGGAVNVVIDGCKVTDLAYFTNDPNHSDRHTHNDAIQIQGGSRITIKNSVLLGLAAKGVGQYDKNPYRPAVTGQAIAVTPNVAKVSWLHVEGNHLDGGANSITLIPGKFGAVANIGTIQGNTFGRQQHTGRAAAIHPSIGVTWKNNTWDDGTPVNPVVTTNL